ncbi:MAG: hypothetical protein R2748_20945 [Bryobacterales bacterium]
MRTGGGAEAAGRLGGGTAETAGGAETGGGTAGVGVVSVAGSSACGAGGCCSVFWPQDVQNRAEPSSFSPQLVQNKAM